MRADYQDLATRDLGEYDILYLFIAVITERIRPGQRREPVLAAWGFTSGGGNLISKRIAVAIYIIVYITVMFAAMKIPGSFYIWQQINIIYDDHYQLRSGLYGVLRSSP